MIRRIGYILMALAVAVMLLWMVSYWWRKSVVPNRYQAQIAALEDDNPLVRIEAAQKLLDMQYSDPRIRLVLAEALADTLRFERARKVLDPLLQDNPELGLKVHALLADFALQSTELLVADASFPSLDLLTQRIEPLLQEAADHAAFVEAHPQAGILSFLLAARASDIRATLLETRQRYLEGEWAKVTTVQADMQLHDVGLHLAQVNSQLTELHRQTDTLYRHARLKYPADMRSYAIFIRTCMRRRDFGQARQTLEELVNQSGPVDRNLAGQIARIFFNTLWTDAQSLTPHDIALLRRLLNHPGLTGLKGVHFRLAQTALAASDQQWDQVLALSKQTMAIFQGHPQSVCYYNLALAHLGDPDQAVKNLSILCEHEHAPYYRFVLAKVLFMAGQPKLALERCRQALDLQPDAILPRLLMIQILFSQGYIGEAESDILELYARRPTDPEILHMYVRLMVNKQNIGSLAELLEKQHDPALWNTPDAWRRPALAALLILDDAAFAKPLAESLRKDHPTDLLAFLAEILPQADPLFRLQASAMVTQVVMNHIQPDPWQQLKTPARLRQYRLAYPKITSPTSLNPLQPAEDQITDLTAIYAHTFIDSPYQASLELLQTTRARWPQAQGLALPMVSLQLLCGQREEALGHLPLLRAEPAGATVAEVIEAVLQGPPSQAQEKIGKVQRDAGQAPRMLWDWLELAAAARNESGKAWELTVVPFLERRPWAMPLLQLALHESLVRKDYASARVIRREARSLNLPMALMAAGCYAMATSQWQDGSQALDLLLAEQPWDSEFRFSAGEAALRCLIATEQIDQAASLLDRWGSACSYRSYALQIMTADMLAEYQREAQAISLLSRVAADQDAPAYWRDLALSRLVELMPTDRAMKILDTLTQIHPENDLLRAYYAMLLLKNGLTTPAEPLIRSLAKIYPDSPRILALQAIHATARNDPYIAREYWRKILAMGEPLAPQADLLRQETDAWFTTSTLTPTP